MEARSRAGELTDGPRMLERIERRSAAVQAELTELRARLAAV
jgi:hypothetical protein